MVRGADSNYGDELVMKGRGRSDEEVPLWRRGITSEDKEALKYSMTWAVYPYRSEEGES